MEQFVVYSYKCLINYTVLTIDCFPSPYLPVPVVDVDVREERKGSAVGFVLGEPV